MTTNFDALIVHEDKKYAQQAAMAVFAEVSRVERLLSRYDPGTDLAQANRMRPGEYMVVNLEVVECLEIAARAYQATGGAYDAAYRSRRGGRASAMDFLLLSHPDAGTSDISEAFAPREFLVGFAADAESHGYGVDMTIPIEARMLEPGNSIDPTPPDGLNLDLGGIGKGYALDKALAILDDWDISNALLSAGTSTVLARGAGPDGAGWPVGVSGDFSNETGIQKIHLHNMALSGSGTAIKGEHVRTPETGEAALAAAAWALAESATWSDAIATALMVMPRARAEDFAQNHPDTAIIAVYPAAAPLVAGPWPTDQRAV